MMICMFIVHLVINDSDEFILIQGNEETTSSPCKNRSRFYVFRYKSYQFLVFLFCSTWIKWIYELEIVQTCKYYFEQRLISNHLICSTEKCFIYLKHMVTFSIDNTLPIQKFYLYFICKLLLKTSKLSFQTCYYIVVSLGGSRKCVCK